ncbi:hypothetical protein GGR51DRAFT_570718 [Nemania sp. FL0031]|nr:hypothetical protein GGR51DRAFT_570718 [Nemania sp. FL0031]
MALGTDDKSADLALWLCNGIMLTMILALLGLRKWRGLSFTIGDGWLVLALLFNGVRVAGDIYAKEYGTPLDMSVLIAAGEREDPRPEMSAQDQDNMVLAGKLMIAARVATIAVLWSLKMAVLDMLLSLWGGSQRNRGVFCYTYIVLAVTFFASIMSVFFECQELRFNWTLFPDTGQCAYDAAWMITYEISNIFTDVMLYVLIPVLLFIMSAVVSKREQVRMAALVLGVGLMAVEIIRLDAGLSPTDVLLYRIVWGSIEIAIATSNATILAILTLLLTPRSKEVQGESGETTHEQGSAVAAGAAGEAKPEPPSLQRIELWDYPICWDDMGLDTEDMTRKLVARDSIHGSTLSSVSAAAGNRDSWPRSIRSLRNVIRSPRPRSRLGRGTRVTDDNQLETLHKWIELEETDTSSVIRGASSPEPNDGAGRSGIFVATEINQEIHRIRDLEQRPRIVTIPRRARLDRSQV